MRILGTSINHPRHFSIEFAYYFYLSFPKFFVILQKYLIHYTKT
jgi:hypothetical protein